MKNLRIARKDPSKILRILEAPPRYAPDNPNPVRTSRPLPASPSRQSPSRSQQLNSLERARRLKSRSLHRSDEAIRSLERRSLQLVRNSAQAKAREASPYVRSSRLLQLQSTSLAERNELPTRRKSLSLRADHHEDKQEGSQAAVESARRLLGQGEYRKCLLVVRPMLRGKVGLQEALYLSAVCWYHLQEKVKAIPLLEQLLAAEPLRSADCYKMLAVCHSRSLEYGRSFQRLQECHRLFPGDWESYELEAKLHLKTRNWESAYLSYTQAHRISQNPSMLASIASCLQKMQRYGQAETCLIRALEHYPNDHSLRLKLLQTELALKKYLEIIRKFKDWDGVSPTRDEGLQSRKDSEMRSEINYVVAYAYYKLGDLAAARIMAEEAKTENASRSQRLHLMVLIGERNFYEALRLVQSIKEKPELRVLIRFVEGVIGLMRRNYTDGIATLMSIQEDLGFTLAAADEKVEVAEPPTDEFHRQLRNIYPMFLSYGFFSLAEFSFSLQLMQLQQELGVPPYFERGLSYNMHLCEGIILHCHRKFQDAEPHFLEAQSLIPARLEPPFSLALNYLQLMLQAEGQARYTLCERSKQQFAVCRSKVGEANTNTAAAVFYFSCLLHGEMGEWRQALLCIDESIERAEDHYWRYFYVRAMLLACIHSFREASNDLTVALSVAGGARAECYLLRSKCLQIEGEGAEAFRDLQEYISLKPDDPQVHKYAGQLLFENGAFEDALTAFSHQPLPRTLPNADIFMTQGKSYFLLGRFSDAAQAMRVAFELRPTDEVRFDLLVLDILERLIERGDSAFETRTRIEELFAQSDCLGRIFKRTDCHMLRGVCFVQEELYEQAVDCFERAVAEKDREVSRSEDLDEVARTENEKEVETFASQMRYNVVVCELAAGREAEAMAACQNVKIPHEQPYFPDFINFRRFVAAEIPAPKREEVFPSRNKLSNFLPKVPILREPPCFLKLCIPFPKVEPPEIFPQFDSSLLQRLSVLNVERKPQAPWVVREQESIKFTQKMQTYSRLQLSESEADSASTYQIISVDQSHLGRHSSRVRSAHFIP